MFRPFIELGRELLDRVDLIGSVNPALQKAFSICRIPSLFNIYGFNEDSFNNITNSALKHNPYFVSLLIWFCKKLFSVTGFRA